ncbi:MAG: hypothetical protein ACTSVV_11110 [Promethearchaeota archaeon]
MAGLSKDIKESEDRILDLLILRLYDKSGSYVWRKDFDGNILILKEIQYDQKRKAVFYVSGEENFEKELPCGPSKNLLSEIWLFAKIKPIENLDK